MIRKIATAALVAIVATLTPMLSGAAHADAVEPTRIMLVGDSITQSEAGHYSWRRDLWRSLSASGAYNFVGPRNDQFLSYDGVDNDYTTSGYPDSNFDLNHAARWGMSLGSRDWDLNHLTYQYQPDVVVLALGTNDVLWDADRIEDGWAEFRVRQTVEDTRRGNPAAKIVLTKVYRENGLRPGAREGWNAIIDTVATSMNTEESPIVVADWTGVTATDLYDGTHPGRTGEVKIAESIRQALVSLGVGVNSAPIKAGTPARATSVRAAKIKRGVRVSWSTPAASSTSELWKRSRVKVNGRWRAWGQWSRVWKGSIAAERGDDFLAPAKRVTRHQYRVRTVEAGASSGWSASNVVTRRP